MTRKNISRPSATNIPQTELNPKQYMELSVYVPVAVDAVTTPLSVTYKQLAVLAEQQIINRIPAVTLPSSASSATVFQNVQLKHVHAWGPSPTLLGEDLSKQVNFMQGLTLRVGQASAMVPKSTKSDVVEGANARPFASCAGNATTWGPRTSDTVAFTVTPSFGGNESSANATGKFFFLIGVNLF